MFKKLYRNEGGVRQSGQQLLPANGDVWIFGKEGKI